VPGVAIFVDLANIHIGLKLNYMNPPPYERLAQVINEYGANQGEVRIRNVYTDWNDSRIEKIARQFASAGFRALQVTRKASGKDRTDICLSLDALEIFNQQQPELDTMVLVSGDADYVEIMQRLRQKGKRLFIMALEKNFASELLPYVTGHTVIEKELASIGFPLYPYEPFLKLLYGLQQFHCAKGGFVAAKLFLRKICEKNLDNDLSPTALLGQLIESKVVETYQVENPINPERPTTAVKLNDGSEIVSNFYRMNSIK